jgi:hypothetical protein
MGRPRKRIALSGDEAGGRITRHNGSGDRQSSDGDEITAVGVSHVPRHTRRAVSAVISESKKLNWEVVIPWDEDVDRSQYREIPGENEVRKVLEEMKTPRTQKLQYKTRFIDGHIDTVSTIPIPL